MVTESEAGQSRLARELTNPKKRIEICSVLQIFSYIAAATAIATSLAIVGFIFVNGIPHLSLHFIFGANSYFNITMSGMLVSTLKLVAVSLAIAVPVGIGAAVYLVEYTGRGNKLVKVIRTATETLAGVPSIVFGIFGMMVFVRLFGWGLSVWSGGLTLALLILPTVVTTVEESLRAVPDSFREASFGLGAGKLRTVGKVSLPCAVPGILSAVILSVGRVVSESACVMFTAGNSYNMGKRFGDGGATMAVGMYLLASENHLGEAYAIGVVLIAVVVGLNLLSSLAAARLSKSATG